MNINIRKNRIKTCSTNHERPAFRIRFILSCPRFKYLIQKSRTAESFLGLRPQMRCKSGLLLDLQNAYRFAGFFTWSTIWEMCVFCVLKQNIIWKAPFIKKVYSQGNTKNFGSPNELWTNLVLQNTCAFAGFLLQANVWQNELSSWSLMHKKMQGHIHTCSKIQQNLF